MALISEEFETRGHFRYEESCLDAEIDDFVWLIAEPDNEFDKNAIRIINEDGEMLGYVPREINMEILNYLEEGEYCSKIIRIEEDEDELPVPVIKAYFAKSKSDLPFLQEERFSLHLTVDLLANTETYEIIDKRDKQHDDIERNNSKAIGSELFPVIIVIIISIVLLTYIF